MKFKQGERFTCSICSKHLIVKKSLVIHQQIHTCRVVIREQILICSVCKLGFCTRNDLKTHKRKHDIALKTHDRKHDIAVVNKVQKEFEKSPSVKAQKGK